MLKRRHVALGTISFTVCFAAWGLISAFAPRFRKILHLTRPAIARLPFLAPLSPAFSLRPASDFICSLTGSTPKFAKAERPGSGQIQRTLSSPVRGSSSMRSDPPSRRRSALF